MTVDEAQALVKLMGWELALHKTRYSTYGEHVELSRQVWRIDDGQRTSYIIAHAHEPMDEVCRLAYERIESEKQHDGR